jgi:hypothetical protein
MYHKVTMTFIMGSYMLLHHRKTEALGKVEKAKCPTMSEVEEHEADIEEVI